MSKSAPKSVVSHSPQAPSPALKALISTGPERDSLFSSAHRGPRLAGEIQPSPIAFPIHSLRTPIVSIYSSHSQAKATTPNSWRLRSHCGPLVKKKNGTHLEDQKEWSRLLKSPPSPPKITILKRYAHLSWTAKLTHSSLLPPIQYYIKLCP